MKKVVSVISISAILFVGTSGLVAANAETAPEPGATCAMGTAMTGGIKVVKKKTYVCMPDGEWSKALRKSKSPLDTEDMWVKSADKGMTAAFGTISNPTTKDIRIIGVRSNLFTPIAQFHEMAKDAGGTNDHDRKEKGPCDSGR